MILFKNGCEVVIRSDKICKLSEHAVKHHCTCLKAFCNIIKESDFFPVFYLVHFYKENTYYYCEARIIKVVSSTPVSHIIDRYQSSRTINKLKDVSGAVPGDDDLIMCDIFCSKLHYTPSHEQMSVLDIIQRFKSNFPRLNESKVYQFLKKIFPSNVTSPSKKKHNKPSTSILFTKTQMSCTKKVEKLCYSKF